MKKKLFVLISVILVLSLFEIFSFSVLKLYSFQNKKETKVGKVNEYIYAEDLSQIKNYSAFYGWRGFYSDQTKFKVRKNILNKNWNQKNYIYFFGGSTVIGEGANFDGTIPSHFATLEHTLQPMNMGDMGYVSGQSLNRLIEIIDKINKNDIIVFYEGVNDVITNCQEDLGPNGHSRVKLINDLIKNDGKIFINLYIKVLELFQKTNSFNFINGLSKKLFSYDLLYQQASENYSCTDKKIANQVANNLIRHWSIANYLADMKGAKFFAFLQPSPYTADFEVNVPSREIWKKSYEDVYPKIRNLMSEKNNFYDLSKILKKDFYIDWCCHLNSDGNRIIAKKIFNIIF